MPRGINCFQRRQNVSGVDYLRCEVFIVQGKENEVWSVKLYFSLIEVGDVVVGETEDEVGCMEFAIINYTKAFTFFQKLCFLFYF